MSTAAEAIQSSTPAPSPAPTPAPSPAPSPTPSPTPAPSPAPSPTPTPAATDRWQDKWLPEGLRSDETLSRFGSIEDLAKGHVETMRWARGRIAVPGADDAQGFADFAAKVRPEKAEEYKILDANGQPTDTGEAFRGIFHEAGLHPMQAERITQAWNQHVSDQLSRATQAGKDEVKAIELEMGPAAFTQRNTAAQNMLGRLGIEVEDLLPALEQIAGSGKALAAMHKLAEATGELAKVDGATVQLNMGAMTAAQAQNELDRMNGDAATREKIRSKDGPTLAKRKALMDRVTKGD